MNVFKEQEEIKINSLIGLEIHITLKSEKKNFNWKKNYQKKNPNSEIGPWELGYPGFLPIINPEVIELGLKLALSLKMKIEKFIIFDRKIYNYFDLPKGYQITQKNFPFAKNGSFEMFITNQKLKVPIKKLQLEEDTAKSIYCEKEIKLDFNRAGNPLVELVTKPFFKDINVVVEFIKQLRIFLIFFDLSEAKMEEGHLRIDLNYSVNLKEKK